jgi:hypothetical protein
VRRVEDFNT